MTEPGKLNGVPDRKAEPQSRDQVSLYELADLDAGLLTQDEEQRLRTRIANDPNAAKLLAALEQIRAYLTELRYDEPVPDDVMKRLDAALAAEAAATEAGTDPVQHDPTDASTEASTMVQRRAADRGQDGPQRAKPRRRMG